MQDQSAEHAHAIGEQAAVGRVMNHRLHRRAIDAQLAPACHPRLNGERRDAIIACVQLSTSPVIKPDRFRLVLAVPHRHCHRKHQVVNRSHDRRVQECRGDQRRGKRPRAPDILTYCCHTPSL